MTEQAGFTEALLNPECAVPQGLVNPDGRRAAKRFNVYRNNVTTSLTDALETAFPVIRKLLGEANFRVLARAYLRRHPPGSPLLMFYGTQLPEFLTSFSPTRDLGYLPDVARLELAIRQSYHSAESIPLDSAVLQIPPERLMAARMTLAPSVRVVRSVWPICGIWRFNMEYDAPKPQACGENAFVCRPEFDPHPWTLPPGGDRFLIALLEGARFGEALNAALTGNPEFDLAKTLGMLLDGAAITRLEEDS